MDSAELLYEVARRYYELNETQATISRALNVSRPTVSRYLKQAREQGIVSISLRQPFKRDLGLEEAIQAAYQLRDCRVIQTENQAPDETLKRVARVAADYFEHQVQDGDVVVCSYGRAVAETIKALKPSRPLNINVVQMIGALGTENPFMDGPDLVRMLSEKYAGEYRYLLAPLVVEDSTVADSLMKQARFKAVSALATSARLAISGVGGMQEAEPNPIFKGYLDAADWKQLRAAGAVAHMVGCFLDENGQALDLELNRRTVRINFEAVTAIPYLLVVATGVKKALAMRAVLRGGHCKVLFTDELAAREILRLY